MKVKATDAVVVIDVINPLDFENAQSILPWAKRLIPRLERLLRA